MHYRGERIVITTRHGKARALAPPLQARLGATLEAFEADTDTLGTFSGEVERSGSALECARRKCEWGLAATGARFGLASEGSFGPHPVIPFIAGDEEILYFIDRQHDFHLHLSLLSGKTNYAMATVGDAQALADFAERARFPDHALVLRPESLPVGPALHKGIASQEALAAAFAEAQQASPDGRVRVETDMRAHLNPMRMAVIAELGAMLAARLAADCPACGLPGWGQVRVRRGLPCGDCGAATRRVLATVEGCVRCDFESTRPREDGCEAADPGDCDYCNP